MMADKTEEEKIVDQDKKDEDVDDDDASPGRRNVNLDVGGLGI